LAIVPEYVVDDALADKALLLEVLAMRRRQLSLGVA
jgi:hypothetical protein